MGKIDGGRGALGIRTLGRNLKATGKTDIRSVIFLVGNEPAIGTKGLLGYKSKLRQAHPNEVPRKKSIVEASPQRGY